jgi:transcription antitermination protein NusB
VPKDDRNETSFQTIFKEALGSAINYLREIFIMSNSKKRQSRLAAIQALYQASYGEMSAPAIAEDYLKNGFDLLIEDGNEGEKRKASAIADIELFRNIVSGVAKEEVSLDEMITGSLSAGVSGGRLERIIKTILRAGVYELIHHQDTHQGVIINDYVDIARSFYSGKEPALINAILDGISKKIRC